LDGTIKNDSGENTLLFGPPYGISTLSHKVTKYMISAATAFVTQFSVLLDLKPKKKK